MSDMPLKTAPFEPEKYLTTPQAQREFLKDAFASGDAGYIADALGIIARARGAAEIASSAGLTREIRSRLGHRRRRPR
jgi:probable addiction module antidote protein